MKFIISQILVFSMITSFAGAGQALTMEECSRTGQQCLCTAFPGMGAPICAPLQNMAYKMGYGLKE
jgi:hypothetical protein